MADHLVVELQQRPPGSFDACGNAVPLDHGPLSEIPAATLIGLPFELRDMVYRFLLEDDTKAPQDPDHPGRREPPYPTSGQSIFFEAHSPKPSLLQLKLCCRQVYDEVSDVLLKHGPSGPTSSHLDIMVKGSSIWPTWTSLPVTAYFDPVVNINLRIFEATGFGNEFSTGAYRALWSLFNLLVFRGPCFMHSRGLESPLVIGRLRFNITLCFPTSVEDLFGTCRDVFERIERLAYDNVGLSYVKTIEACMGSDRRVWRLKQLPTGLTFASRQ